MIVVQDGAEAVEEANENTPYIATDFPNAWTRSRMCRGPVVKKRPFGAAVHTGLSLLSAIVLLCLMREPGVRIIRGQPDSKVLASVFALGVLSLGFFGVGIGLLMLKRWSQWLATCVALGGVIGMGWFGVVMWKELIRDSFSLSISLLVFGWNGWAFWYFLRQLLRKTGYDES